MARLVQAVRFFVGLTLVAAGVIAAGPYVATLVSAYRREMAVPPQPEPAALPGVAIASPPLAPTMPARAAEASQRAFPPANEPAPVPSAPFVPRADYRPPAPPGTLPPLPPDLARPTPAIAAAYRSTLDVPPPPLLDSDAPPPLAVGWTATGGGRTAGRTPASQPSVETSTYVVRDGDDLTAIAMKVYGHAGGAQAIWEVNRDHLADPNLLPIGLVLRIPPAWSVPAVRPEAASQRLIEPGQRPARVRVTPGETLESLAQRFYGDPALATRLYEVNRDRLRSPALLVPGMELRLP